MENDVKESILDTPREGGLDSSLWVEKENGNYTLTEEAKRKIFFVIKWMTQNDETPLNNFGVNLVGSMTSNSYSDTSDIDLHFNSTEISEDQAEEFNKEFRKRFDEQFKSVFSQEDWTISGHPIEVYFQINPVQDLMSVGCYDVIRDEWKVGPELKDDEFDPYSEYYQEDMKYIQDVVQDIRNVILECFESAIVISKSNDERFKKFETQHLVDRLGKAAKIFTDAREYRKIKSSPRTEEQAKQYRISRDWKIADSAFKLLDKFGYLGILRTMTQCYESLSKGEITQDQAVQTIISSIRENFSNNKNLEENEKCLFEELQEESLKDIAKYAMLMGTLASPIANAEGGQKKSQDTIPRQELNVLNKKVGDMTYSQVLNSIAWTIWTEARGEYKRNGIKSLNAIASVIWNRADGKPENFSKVIGKPKQFSWWNGYSGGFEDGSYVSQSPSKEELKNPENSRIWNVCNQIASKMMEGKFTSTIGNRNMIVNPKLDDQSALDSWGSNADLTIGNHKFAYDKTWDGKYRYGKNVVKKQQQKIHTISKGDTIGQIAKKYNTTVEKILSLNPTIKNANLIKIGQKIRV